MAIFMTVAATAMLLLTIYGVVTIGWDGALGLFGFGPIALRASQEWRARRDEVASAEEFQVWMTQNG
jgi:hypothetical protein